MVSALGVLSINRGDVRRWGLALPSPLHVNWDGTCAWHCVTAPGCGRWIGHPWHLPLLCVWAGVVCLSCVMPQSPDSYWIVSIVHVNSIIHAAYFLLVFSHNMTSPREINFSHTLDIFTTFYVKNLSTTMCLWPYFRHLISFSVPWISDTFS